MFDHLGLPDSPLCVAAVELAREHEHAAIFNHSIRTFLHAERAAPSLELRAGTDYDRAELLLACVLHDLGTAAAYDGRQRFEVDGADAATGFLAAREVAAAVRQRVWEAIALHTCAGIAERMAPLTRLTRAGVVGDFSRPNAADRAWRQDIETPLPRLHIERELADAVVGQAVRNPAKAPRATWPGMLLQAHLADPHHTGRNPAF